MSSSVIPATPATPAAPATPVPPVPTTPPTPTEKAIRRKPDPFPYILVFTILFFVAIGLLTWVLDTYNKSHLCTLNPNMWCTDNWTCQTACTIGTSGVCSATNANGNTYQVKDCFCSSGTTGLASCLFGPEAEGSNTCSNPGINDTGVGDCVCPDVLTTAPTDSSLANNCLNSCAGSITELANQYCPNGVCTNLPFACCCNAANFTAGTAEYAYCTQTNIQGNCGS